MRPLHNSRGMAFIAAIMILLFLMPLAMIFSKRIQTQSQLNTKERIIKTTRTLAVNAMIDYMRQFSNDHCEDHFADKKLKRTSAFYEAGFTDVDITSNTVARTVHIRATGKYGSKDDPRSVKTLKGTIQFVSDFARFGNMFNTTYVNKDGATYNGGWYVYGDLIADGDGTHNYNRHVVVDGSIGRISGSDIKINFNSDVYVQNTYSTHYKFSYSSTPRSPAPKISWPELNVDYYKDRQTYKSQTPVERWVFNVDGSVDIYHNCSGGSTVSGSNSNVSGAEDLKTYSGAGTFFQKYNLPTSGEGVLVAEGANLILEGTVRGRYTVVCVGTPHSLDEGNVEVRNSFRYHDGSGYTNNASAKAAVAVLATNKVILANTSTSASYLTMCGIFFSQENDIHALNMVNNTVNFSINGVRAQRKFVHYKNSPYRKLSGWNFNADDQLQKFPPPMLPERPVLVNLTMR